MKIVIEDEISQSYIDQFEDFILGKKITDPNLQKYVQFVSINGEDIFSIGLTEKQEMARGEDLDITAIYSLKIIGESGKLKQVTIKLKRFSYEYEYERVQKIFDKYEIGQSFHYEDVLCCKLVNPNNFMNLIVELDGGQ
ncbi:gp489 [Bacillus phage G]|uniref:Gp489 n=1 Tax=Bacillus phage G TaxID=2884420 RepID=G3MAN0_9CAUD|nr:gp489 [Bacillus phage G]AEO93747.1 gp489 [Bacillus phage G]